MSEEIKFHPYFSVEDDTDSDYAALPEIREAALKKEAAIYDITRELAGITYAGSGLKIEMVELEQNMRQLLNEHIYGYKYIEGFLISMGYNLNRIRQTFKRLTGVDPQVYMDAQPTLDTPGNIPGQNYGWGKSKDKKFDYYFCMPHLVGFAVFGQKGDLIREEIKYLASLDEAREFLKKKVSDVHIYDEVVTVDKLAPKDNQYLSEDFLPFGTKTAAYTKIEKYFSQLGQHMQLSEKKAVLEDALANGQISKIEFRHLATQNGILRQADPDIEKTDKEGNPDVARITTQEILDEEDKLEKTPIKEELDKTTPTQLWEMEKEQNPGENLPELTEFVIKSIYDLGEQLTNFSVHFKRFDYIAQDILDRLEKTPQVGDDKAKEVLNSSGTAMVILDFIDKTLPPESNMKQGMIIYSVIGSEVLSNDVFKGKDDKTYALNEEGLEKYFFTDRQKQESK